MNYELRIKNKGESGFTFVELLASMIVLSVVGGVIGSILFSSLRGVNKTNVVTVVQQNGNYALEQMARMIRNAQRLDSLTSKGGLTIPSTAGNFCISFPSPTPAYLYSAITIKSSDGLQTTFQCNGQGLIPPNTIASISASVTSSLLDTSAVSLVFSTCGFTCQRSSLFDSPVIGIKFSLTQFNPVGGPQLFPENTAALDFQTSVSMRNFMQ